MRNDSSHCDRKPTVVIRHSGLDESGDSNASEGSDFLLNANGHLDVASLPKGWSKSVFIISSPSAQTLTQISRTDFTTDDTF